ncbi:MAG: serine/threonine-protein kinase [bacterium]
MAIGAQVGQLVGGRFEVRELLGSGGMAEVYVAVHAEVGRKYAIKFLHEDIQSDAVLVERFRREARAISRLDHPNIVSIVDFGRTAGNKLYLVMEYVEGPSLQDAIEQVPPPGRLPGLRSLSILVQLCDAAGAAHDSGVVHRDLKPENILLASDHAGGDVVKVLDFGLAKIMEGAEMTQLTTKGEIFGTPDYMSPEQARGDPVDHRTDIYALGAIAYELFAGRPVFVANSLPRLLIKHQELEPEPPSRLLPPGAEGIPEAVEELILRCLEKTPERRPQTTDELREVFQSQREARRESASRIPVPNVVMGASVREQRDDWHEITLDADTGVHTDPGVAGYQLPSSRDAPEDSATRREWYWTQAVKKARELAQRLRDQRLGSVRLIRMLGNLSTAEERTMSVETEIALAESRLSDLDKVVREAEARLRSAVVDLSVERGRLQDEGAHDNVYADLDFQINVLEQRLAHLYRKTDDKKHDLVQALRGRQERLQLDRQKQTAIEVRLINRILSVRPFPCPLDIQSTYETLEDLLIALKQT